MEMSESEVVTIAKEACIERGIRWREPYAFRRRWRSWFVLIPLNVRGGNAVIRVSKATGEARIRYYGR
jgi:hypothetical protein